MTLNRRGEGGKFEKVSFTVDTKLPTQKDQPQKPAYANLNQAAAPLWPALLEKAYAILVGGYATAGEGGQPGNAMEALTGTPKDNESMPDKDKMIEQFKNYEMQGKAVDVSTLGEMKRTKQTPFTGKGDRLSAVLTTDENQPAAVKKSSLTVDDNKSKNKFYDFDDGQGKLGGGDVLAGGTVDYPSGKVGLDFKKGKGPDNPKNVEASYGYHELISKDYNLYANHAYIFVKTSGDNLILKNPWGAGDAYEPKPIPGATFAKFFQGRRDQNRR